MALAIRLSRGGAKKRPFYRIVVADSRMPRDGRYIERLGTYNPLLKKDDENRVKMELERIQYWIGQGARPSDRVSRFLEAAGVAEKKERSNPQKALPGKKAQERIDAAREAEEAAKAQPEEEAKPAEEEKPAEEAAAAEKAPAEEAAAEEAPAEEAPAEEAAAEETPAAEAPSDSDGEEKKPE